MTWLLLAWLSWFVLAVGIGVFIGLFIRVGQRPQTTEDETDEIYVPRERVA